MAEDDTVVKFNTRNRAAQLHIVEDKDEAYREKIKGSLCSMLDKIREKVMNGKIEGLIAIGTGEDTPVDFFVCGPFNEMEMVGLLEATQLNLLHVGMPPRDGPEDGERDIG